MKKIFTVLAVFTALCLNSACSDKKEAPIVNNNRNATDNKPVAKPVVKNDEPLIKNKDIIINTDISPVAVETIKEKEEIKEKSLIFKFLEETKDFRQKVDDNWNINLAVSSERKVIKYMNDYNSRLIVDYDKRRIKVDTKSREAVPQTVSDAFGVNLNVKNSNIFNGELKKGKAPFLLADLAKMPKENELKPVLINNSGKPYYRVEIPFNEDINIVNILAKKADRLLTVYARKYRLNKDLLAAMAKTLSSYNSWYYNEDEQRFGLFALSDKEIISDEDNSEISYETVIDLEGNINLMGKYLASLKGNQFKRIFDKEVLDLSLIAAYHMGADNYLKLFSRNKQQAVSIINAFNANYFYDNLAKKLPYSTKIFMDNVKQNYKK